MKHYNLIIFLVLFIGTCLWGQAKEEPAPAPDELLKHTIQTYYNPSDHGLKRAACYVTCPEIIKLLDSGLRNLIQSTDFEAIIKPGQAVDVKARNIPGHYGHEARKAIAKHQEKLERQLKIIFNSFDVVKRIFSVSKNLSNFELTTESEKRLTKITVKPKQAKSRRRNPKKPLKKRLSKNNQTGFDQLIIWITKDYIIDKIEITGPQGESVVKVKSSKYRKCWTARQVDITKYDRDECFDQRTLIKINYTYPQNIMMPSSIIFTLLDKKGIPLERRNEANPVSVKFADYQVELKEKK